MHVESLELKNFRNYERIVLDFDSGTNVLYGDNAQGKTNLLEAIHVLGTTKSHKGSHDSEMIRFGEDEAHMRLIFRKNGIAHKVDMHLKKNGKKGVAIDGLPIRKAADLFGMINIVLFSPEDLNIIKHGPKERRRFLDSELCQLDKIYYQNLADYNRILVQRNALLKDIPFNPSLEPTLDVWDMQLIRLGSHIIEQRSRFTRKLNEIVVGIHENLTGGREQIEIIYEPDVTAEEFEEKLTRGRPRDLKLKTSGTGPHRDDFRVQVNGIDIRHFGSQGQQRSAALSLKLSEIYLVKEMIGDTPVLLLDDVLSELDRNRQKTLLQNMNDIQTLITCTGLDELIENNFPVNRAFHIVNGSVESPGK
uniref:DNA replication and repair protein RecF n=1 Tax=Eubacterium cellulosolvens (strain ATCC 43171 / JCM 9499 / 6) TaxID=633697 RepID=I5ATW1_EUBC6